MTALERLRIRTASVITVAWVVSLAIDAVPKTYLDFSASPYVHGAMMAVAAWLYTTPVLTRKNGNGNGATNGEH